MSSRKTGSGSHAAQRSGSRYDRYDVQYTYGSAAPALRPGKEQRSSRSAQNDHRRNAAGRPAAGARRADRMNPAMIAFMMAVMCAMCVCLFRYIGLQSEVTNAVEEIASLESQLSDLKSDNDEALNAINSSVSLDDIKYRAIAELDMIYAQEDQIITYSNDDTDYVRQVIQP